MRVIMFQPRFINGITAGTKTTTIRAKARCSPGDVLSLRYWTGLPYRSKHGLIMDVACSAVDRIEIREHYLFLVRTYTTPLRPFYTEYFQENRLGEFHKMNQLAESDGFSGGWLEMKEWFAKTHGLPFEGALISWAKG